jgi:hypothetical protein
LKASPYAPRNRPSDAGGAAVHVGTISRVSKIWAPFMSRYTPVVATSHSRARFTYSGDGMFMDRIPFERADAPG